MARRRRMSGQKASAFAPGMKSGRTLTWEELVLETTADSHSVVFNNLAFAAGGFDVRYRVLIPPNVLRGVVTLERTKISWDTYFLDIAIDAAGEGFRTSMPWLLCLTPVRDGAIQDAAVLDPRNAADLENNAIIARGLRLPNLSTPDGTTFLGARHYDGKNPVDIDVKSKRRFARDQWALILVTSVGGGTTTEYRHNLDIRALFRAADGV